jgi:hypothetical protein
MDRAELQEDEDGWRGDGREGGYKAPSQHREA